MVARKGSVFQRIEDQGGVSCIPQVRIRFNIGFVVPDKTAPERIGVEERTEQKKKYDDESGLLWKRRKIQGRHLKIKTGQERERGNMEAATGFEPVIRALQARALPLGYAATTVSAFH